MVEPGIVYIIADVPSMVETMFKLRLNLDTISRECPLPNEG